MDDGWPMNYTLYKLNFPVGVHFGNGGIETTDYTICADVFFSALCIEAVREQEDILKALIDFARSGDMLISDALPFVGDEYYIPKPLLTVEKKEDLGDSVIKKVYKKMKYIPFYSLDEFLSGNMVIPDTSLEERLGRKEMKVSAVINEGEDTLPYRIGTFLFNEGSGLYIILGYSDNKIKETVDQLIEGVSYSGIGGRRSSGLGRFIPIEKKLPDEMFEALNEETGRYMTLSLSLPRESEIDKVLMRASYQILKRSGFVSSETYADSYFRKRDLYATAAGSVYEERFEGDIYDVSCGGKHPVWRYAKPMFICL